MNIQQAIKSGKKFRRKGWTGLTYASSFTDCRYLDEVDILADDWEIEQVAVTITAQQFWDAYASYIEMAATDRYGVTSYLGLIQHMAERLGLEMG